MEDVLPPAAVAELNAAIDASWDDSYVDGGGFTHACRTGGHQSSAFFEMRGMLEWRKPWCLPFRFGRRLAVPLHSRPVFKCHSCERIRRTGFR